jgi:hypothetical protein
MFIWKTINYFWLVQKKKLRKKEKTLIARKTTTRKKLEQPKVLTE